MKNRISSTLFFILGAAVTAIVFTYCCQDDYGNACNITPEAAVLKSNLYPTEADNGALGFKYNELINYNMLQRLDYAIDLNLDYFNRDFEDDFIDIRNALGEETLVYKGVKPKPIGPIPPPAPSPCDRGVCIFLNLQDQLILTDMPPSTNGTAFLFSPDGQVMNEGSIDDGILYMGQASGQFQGYTGDAHLMVMTYTDGANGFESPQAVTLNAYIEQ